MVHRNPDRMASPPSPLTALTLAGNPLGGRGGARIGNRCRTSLRVSVPALLRAQGPDSTLWGKRPPCPGFDCNSGVLSYSARAISSGSWWR